MFSFLAHLARFKRSDASLFLVAALLAFWAMPLASQSSIASSAHPYQAVLLLLSAEANAPRTQHLGAPVHLEAETTSPDETPLPSKATAHCGAFQTPNSPETPSSLRARRTHDLSPFAVEQLSGISTNVRLN